MAMLNNQKDLLIPEMSRGFDHDHDEKSDSFYVPGKMGPPVDSVQLPCKWLKHGLW